MAISTTFRSLFAPNPLKAQWELSPKITLVGFFLDICPCQLRGVNLTFSLLQASFCCVCVLYWKVISFLTFLTIAIISNYVSQVVSYLGRKENDRVHLLEHEAM